MNKEHIKRPRLFVDQEISADTSLTLSAGQTHYLKNVLRNAQGDQIRVFNSADGEWLCALKDLKKQGGTCAALEQIRPQPEDREPVHLLFSPIKKQRMDFLIEKAVELGVTDLHPLLMRRTEMRKINQERTRAQIIEAAEQSERLDLPKLHAMTKLESLFTTFPDHIQIYACTEREDAPALETALPRNGTVAFLIGPEGGFDEEERTWLISRNEVVAVTLGETILRSETAALACLSLKRLKT